MKKRTIQFHWKEKGPDANMFCIETMACLIIMRTKIITKNNVK